MISGDNTVRGPAAVFGTTTTMFITVKLKVRKQFTNVSSQLILERTICVAVLHYLVKWLSGTNGCENS